MRFRYRMLVLRLAVITDRLIELDVIPAITLVILAGISVPIALMMR